MTVWSGSGGFKPWVRGLTSRRTKQRQGAEPQPGEDPRQFLTSETFAADLVSDVLVHLEVETESDLNQYGIALVDEGQYMPAAAVFGLLVVMADDHSRCGVYRRSLASTMEDLGWYCCSAYHLQRAREQTTSEELRDGCAEQLERLAAITTEADLGTRLRELQLDCCLERIDRGVDGLDDVERLARLVQQSADVNAERVTTAAVAECLATAVREHPGSADLLHGLLHCRLVLGELDGAEDILTRLDDLEPESSVVLGMAERLAAGLRSPPVPPTVADVWRLVQLAGSGAAGLGDDRLRRAALADLRATAARWPHNATCAFAFAFGLLAAGDVRELRAQVDRLAIFERPEQTFHYNIIQLLAGAGEQERARHHVQLALEYATTDTERAEVRELEDRYGWLGVGT